MLVPAQVQGQKVYIGNVGRMGTRIFADFSRNIVQLLSYLSFSLPFSSCCSLSLLKFLSFPFNSGPYTFLFFPSRKIAIL